MQQRVSQSADKIIVERKAAHAGDKSRAAVKNLRSSLGASGGTSQQFFSEVIVQHVILQERSLFSGLLLILLGAYLAHLSLPLEIVGVWTLAGFMLCGWARYAAKVFRDKEPAQRRRRNEREFQFIQAVAGVFWSVLFLAYHFYALSEWSAVLLFAATMVLISLSLVTTRYLTHGVLIFSVPIVTVVASSMLVQSNYGSYGLAAVLVLAVIFFNRIGELMRTSYLEYLQSQAERDQLIMELDSSRSISDEARRRAEEANLAKSRFLATMSHELRTPLNAILGFAEIISNEVMGPLENKYYKEYAGDIHSSGTHLLNLINEILDLSRVEAGRYKLNEEAVNLAHIAEDSQQMVKLKASEKSITVNMQIQSDMPQIWADSRAIRQVILNLLSNALKFTPTGGTIWLKCGWTAGGGQYVSIKDTGPGIPEEEIPIVLSSFGQGSIAIKSAEQGTGLGLPIVQALVHMHDGHFELKSKLREGTEVIASFPRKRVLEVMPPVPGHASVKTQERSGFAAKRRAVAGG